MDCDDVAVLLAAGRTLTGREETGYNGHLATCETCRALARDVDDGAFRWVARVPEDALADPDLLVLPVIDPIVFTRGTPIASGGMGRIWRAHDRRLGREVAIKEVLDPELRARFEREAMITARLQHPAIVPIYEAGTWPDGSAFYTMRLVHGGTLADAIAARKTVHERLALLPNVIAATEAVAYAHSLRIVHRDLKPGNVLVGDFGETVVIDWGLAKELDRDSDDRGSTPVLPSGDDRTRVGAVLGTPCFMSPEQAAGDAVDERADVHALGAILYNLLAGAPPYFDEPARDDVDHLVELGVERPPTPIAVLAPDTPADLRSIVERAMARPLDARYPSAREMAAELRRFEAGQLIAREYTLRELLSRWLRRHRTAVAVAAVAIVALGVVVAAAIVNVTRSRAAERVARRAAEAEQRTSTAALAALLEEDGRAALAAGDRDRALAYLAEAYRRGRDTVALRQLLVDAAREVTLLERTLDAKGTIGAIGFLADGRVVTVEPYTSRVRVWDGDQPATYRVPGDESGFVALGPGARRAVLAQRGKPSTLTMVDVHAGAVLWELVDPFARAPYEIAFDPTGASVLAYGDAFDPQLRDAATGRLVAAVPRGGKDAVVDAAFSADGSRVAIATPRGVRVFDTRTQRVLGALPLGELSASRIAWVTGDRVVIGGVRGEVAVWAIGERSPRALPPHPQRVFAIAASPGGSTFATGDGGGLVRLWNLDGEMLAEARDHHGRISGLQFSPDATAVLGAGWMNTRVVVWDATTLAVRRSIDAYGESGDAMAWSPDGRRFATAGMLEGGHEPARVWTAPTGALIMRSAAWSSALAGTTLVAGEGADLVLRDVASGGERARIADVQPRPAAGDSAGDHLVVDPAGTTALLWGRTAGTVVELATATQRVRYPRPWALAGDPPPRLSIYGRYVLEIGFTHDEAARIIVLDGATGVPVTELGLAVDGGDISPRGDRIVLTRTVARPVLHAIPGGEALPVLDAVPLRVGFHNPWFARFVRSGQRIVAYGVEDPMVIDATTGAVVSTLTRPGLEQSVDAVAADDGGHVVATWSRDLTAALWNADRGALLFAVPDVAPGAIAVTTDGARFATGDAVGMIRVYDATGRLLVQVRAHRRAVRALAFTADGTRLVTQGDDGFATIWDVHLETAAPDAIARLAAERSSWTLTDGVLAPRDSAVAPGR